MPRTDPRAVELPRRVRLPPQLEPRHKQAAPRRTPRLPTLDLARSLGRRRRLCRLRLRLLGHRLVGGLRLRLRLRRRLDRHVDVGSNRIAKPFPLPHQRRRFADCEGEQRRLRHCSEDLLDKVGAADARRRRLGRPHHPSTSPALIAARSSPCRQPASRASSAPSAILCRRLVAVGGLGGGVGRRGCFPSHVAGARGGEARAPPAACARERGRAASRTARRART